MDQNYVDKYIKDQLSTHETEIDNDLLWAAIEQRQKKGKSPIIGIIAFCTVLILGGILAWNAFSSNTLNLQDGTTSTNAISNSNVTNNVTNLSNNTDNNSNLNTSDSKSKSLSALNNINNNKQLYISTENKSDVTTSKVSNSMNKYSDSKPATRESNVQFQTSNLTHSTNDDSESTHQKTQFPNSSETDKNNINLFINTGNSNTGNSTSKNSELNNVLNSEKNIQEVRAATLAQNKLLNPLSEIKNKFTLLSKAFNLPQPNVTDCPTFGEKKRNIYLLGYAFVDYVSPQLSTIDDNQSYLNRRKQTLSYKPSFRLGVQAKYVFNNGIYIRGGIEMGQIRERFKDRIVDTLVEIRPDQLISFYETSPGDTTFIYGNAPVTTISAQNWNVTNKYTSIDIPLLLGYQIKRSNLIYGLELGVMQNIKFSTKAFYLDDSNMPRYVDDYYVDKINLSLTGGISVGYALQSNWSVLGFCHFKQNLSEINSATNPLIQKNLNIGLGIGLQFKL